MRATVLVLAGAAAVLAAALPAAAAIPVYRATVGPGFTITMPKKPTKPGKIRLIVSDRSAIHNFDLRGPGVRVSTSVPGTGTKTFLVTLKKGLYRFVCDPHSSAMKGAFRVT